MPASKQEGLGRLHGTAHCLEPPWVELSVFKCHFSRRHYKSSAILFKSSTPNSVACDNASCKTGSKSLENAFGKGSTFKKIDIDVNFGGSQGRFSNREAIIFANPHVKQVTSGLAARTFRIFYVNAYSS